MGEPLLRERQVAILLANLPDEIALKVTSEGQIRFTRWEQAGWELEKVVWSREETLAHIYGELGSI